MTLMLAVWLVILGALALANLPFLVERPLVPWPWGQAVRSFGGLSRWAIGLGFLVLLAVWSWGTLRLVGGAFGGVGSMLFAVKLLLSIALAALLLYVPGQLARARESAVPESASNPAGVVPASGAGRSGAARKSGAASGKPFIDRFLEVLVGYALIGTLGFTMELDLGNAFPQGWEFYAVTLALFLVLGYPGFVWRYMLQRRRR
ncbi:DUF2818 family protein [Castellaniella sp.]|uniref:DUF2818 family protein n=1 Tax=Castellaniella sp. TaxID=1955812 RepID=UPI003C78D394